jgi:large subunit ribosomal protein L21
MYAIVDIAGQQYKVEKDQKIFVHRLEDKEGSKVDFDKVLLIDNDGKITVGDPLVKNMVVSASIVSHLKGDKVKVFKKKRRKGYKVLNGHRQYMTEIHIDDIGEGIAKAKAAPKKETEKKAAPKTEVKPDAKKTTAVKQDAKPKAVAKTVTKDTTKAKATPKKASTAKPKAALKTEAKTGAKKAPAKKPVAKVAAPKAKKIDDSKSDK